MTFRRIAVLGAGGFLGSHLVPALLSRFGATIDAVDVDFRKLDRTDPRIVTTRARVEEPQLVRDIVGRCDVVVSLCPPHAAAETAKPFSGFGGIYVDANAISPPTAQAIAGSVPRYVDGGVIGPPPWEPGTTRLYLSGAEAPAVAGLFAGSPLEAVVVPSGSASAL